MHAAGGEDREGEEREQYYIYERTGGDAPQIWARARRRLHKSDAAERPEDDAISAAADGTTSEGVPEFVQKHDAEKREVLEQSPDRRVIALSEAREFERGDEEPGEMQIDVDAAKTKKAKGTAHVVVRSTTSSPRVMR